MERRSFSYLALAASAAAVLLALVVLSMRVRAVTKKPELDPSDLARATDGPRAATSVPLTEATTQAPGLPARSRAAVDRPTLADDEAGAGERDLEQPPRAGGPSSSADPITAEEASISKASEFYGTGDYENALTLATEFLKKDPTNERMLRIAASSFCIMGDAEQARVYFARLSPRGQREIARRCIRYGIRL